MTQPDMKCLNSLIARYAKARPGTFPSTSKPPGPSVWRCATRPSPARAPVARTTMPTSSRRTGRSCAGRWAMGGTTRRSNCTCSAGCIGSCACTSTKFSSPGTHTKPQSHQVFLFVFFVPLCETCFTFPPPHGRDWTHTKPQSHQVLFFVFFVPSCEACLTFPPPRGRDWTHTKTRRHQVFFFVFFVSLCEPSIGSSR